ncbi:hypothetical protein [Variovorax guangxiensis]|uniref:hypothetical protein n=1 Tax=Variovorax guangxiensis TaxID=1775474 RepID=UPI00112B223F|nr:hypothetical protein [Variovorax guangxiensis]
MRFPSSTSDTSPYRWLLLAVLLSVVLVQIVAMVSVAQSQVQKAELREAAERAGQVANAGAAPNLYAASRSSRADARGLMQVGYAAAR